MRSPIYKWVLIWTVSTVSACHVYRGVELEGWVVDSETNKPIHGAAVVVTWDIYGGLVHGGTIGRLLTLEAITDTSGHFTFPAWGPKLILWNALRSGAPTLVVAQRGYYIEITGHEDPRGGRPPPSFTSEALDCTCNRQVLKLRKFDGDWHKYAENAGVAIANVPLDSPGSGFACAWQDIPQFSREIGSRAEQLNARKMLHAIPTEKQLRSQRGCSDAG
jgi:hypothetical protein